MTQNECAVLNKQTSEDQNLDPNFDITLIKYITGIMLTLLNLDDKCYLSRNLHMLPALNDFDDSISLDDIEYFSVLKLRLPNSENRN